MPYAGLSGRALAEMLRGQGIGLALNLEVAPSAMLIPAEAVDWLVQTLSNAPSETEARISEVSPPIGLPEAVITGLDRKLAIAAGLARSAYLAAATYEDGSRGHVLAFVDAVEGADEVDRNDLLEGVEIGGRLERAVLADRALRPADAGGVDEHTERAHRLRHLDGIDDVVGAGDVDLAERAADLVGEFVALVLLQVGDDDLGPTGRQHAGGRRSDTGGSTRDDCACTRNIHGVKLFRR